MKFGDPQTKKWNVSRQSRTHTTVPSLICVCVCMCLYTCQVRLCSGAETNPSSASISITIKLKCWTYWACWAPKSVLFTLDWRHVKSFRQRRRLSAAASANRVHLKLATRGVFVPRDYVTKTRNHQTQGKQILPKTNRYRYAVDERFQIFDTQTCVHWSIEILPRRSFRCISS